MKRASLLLLALLIGCAQPAAPQSDAVPTAEPIAAPAEVIVITLEPAASSVPQTPIPTPTASPSPSPSPTPEPTATPCVSMQGILPVDECIVNPYRAETVTTYPKSEDFWYCKLTDATKARIIGSTYPENEKDAPVKLKDLRYVSLLYVDFDGETHTGEMIVHRLVADDVLDIFYRLYEAGYPLASVRLLDDFGEPFDDNVSMAANNTSAYCCRRVTGKKKFSLHAYGVAIDVNPVQNPYIRPDKTVAPPNAEPYRDRSLGEPGMIDENDLCYKLFTEHGWSWGGHFSGEKDYQHFSKGSVVD